MSPIIGILNKNGKDVSDQVNYMMNTCYNQDAEGSWVIADRTRYEWNGYNKAQSLVTNQALGQVSFATRNKTLEQPPVDYRDKLCLIFEGNLYNLKELRSNLLPDHQLTVGSIADVVIHTIEEKCDGNDLETALIDVMGALDGDYCLVLGDSSKITVARDIVGRRPVFYAENSESVAFASKKKALWGIGLRDVKPLRAGMLASFSKKGVMIKKILSLSKVKRNVTADSLDDVVDNYGTLLYAAVEKRLRNLERVGCLISGGVDSCLITKFVADIAAKRGIKVIAYTVGVDGSTDVTYAEHFIHELGLEHKVRRLSQDEINSYIPLLVRTVEERDMVQIEAGIGVYAALDMASQDGIKVIFSGQGPDELWGGYSWYPQVITTEGYDGLERRMLDDLERADIETLDRENKIAMAHSMEIVFPFIDTKIVKLAMSIPPQLKISSAKDKLGKHPHRMLADKMGVAAKYAYRSKDAAQHGTGIHDTFDGIARKNGFTPRLVESIGYHSEEISPEKLASSSRYGYRYGEKSLWEIPDHIQFFLDVTAYDHNLLNDAERTRIKSFLKKMKV